MPSRRSQITQTEHFDMLPFIGLLMCVLGVLLFVTLSIAALAVGPNVKEGWLPMQDANRKKIPVLVELEGAGAVVHGGDQLHSINALTEASDPTNDLKALVSEMYTKRATHYVLFAVRPSAFKHFQAVADQFRSKGDRCWLRTDSTRQTCATFEASAMRVRRSKPEETVQPSLVPMVDLLSNTVGALVFIMIFTVLAASGVVVLKRLPLEHSTKAQEINFLCENDRLYPLDNQGLNSRLRARWGRPYSLFDLYEWIARFNGLEVEDAHFVAKGESTVTYSSYSMSIVFTPKSDGGYSRPELGNAESKYRRKLGSLNHTKQFVHFFVKPDSLNCFFDARKIAMDEFNLGTGWMPLEQNGVLRFVSQGRAATEQ